MKNLLLPEINQYRRKDADVAKYYGDVGNHLRGVFEVPPGTNLGGVEGVNLDFISNTLLRIIAVNEEDWDHISVSTKHRVPHYYEMRWVYRTFFRDDEVAYELHMPPDKHISIHPNVLHIWRPHLLKIPLPPMEFV